MPAIIHHCKQVDNEHKMKGSNIPMLTIRKSENTQMNEKKDEHEIYEAGKEIIANVI